MLIRYKLTCDVRAEVSVFPDVTVFWVVFFIFLTGVIFNGLILGPSCA